MFSGVKRLFGRGTPAVAGSPPSVSAAAARFTPVEPVPEPAPPIEFAIQPPADAEPAPLPPTAEEAADPVLLRVEPEPALPSDDPAESLVVGFNHSWSDDKGVGLLGWAFSPDGDLKQAELCLDGVRVPITAWQPRPDLRNYYPECPIDCGFTVYVPRSAQHRIRIEGKVDGQPVGRSVTATDLPRVGPGDYNDVFPLFDEFTELANRDGFRILEIGSRLVSPGYGSRRERFPRAHRYVGFDYHPDSNTDVVGDAHRLSDYFAPGSFDAVFSVSVLEHLAMPWVVAMEVNRLLVPGGLSYHSTHFAWPAHDVPWDFWRFSDDGLKALFSRPLGFDTMKAGLYMPLRMSPDEMQAGQEMLPLHAGFGGSAILSRKTAEIDQDRFRWRTSLDEVLATASAYPPGSGLEQQAEGTEPGSASPNEQLISSDQ